MNLIIEPSTIWFTFLVTYLFKSTLVLGIGYLAVMIWKTLAVSERYRLLSWTLILSAVLPTVAILLPQWSVLPTALKVPVADQISKVITLIQSPSAAIGGTPVSLMAVFLIVWIVGTLWNLACVLIGQVSTRRIIKQGVMIDDDSLPELAGRVGVDFPVRLVQSSRVAVPFTIGLTRPVIVLPDRFANWSQPEKRMVLLHELAHIARKDAPVHTALVLLNSAYWFNPFVWLALGRIRQFGEEACDEIVVGNGIKPSEYADHLLHILQTINKKKTKRTWRLSGAMITTKSFKLMGGRIMKILTNKKVNHRPGSVRIAWLATMLICSVLALGSFQTKADDKLPSADDFVPMTIMPELITESSPAYPKAAKDKKIEGDVWVQALVLNDGTVHEARIAKSSGSKLLDNSALKAAVKNEYKPGYQEDKPVACWITYLVTFVLQEKDESTKK